MTSNYFYELNRNERSRTRDALSSYVNNLSIFDMDSIRSQAGMLSILTSQSDEVTRYTAVNGQVFIFEKTWIRFNSFKIKGHSNESMFAPFWIFSQVLIYKTC